MTRLFCSLAALGFTLALSACGGGGGGGGGGGSPVVSNDPPPVLIPVPIPGDDPAPIPIPVPVVDLEEPAVIVVAPTDDGGGSTPTDSGGGAPVEDMEEPAAERVVKDWESCSFPYRVFGYASPLNCLPKVLESIGYAADDQLRNDIADKLFIIDSFENDDDDELSHGETIVRILHYLRQDEIDYTPHQFITGASSKDFADNVLALYKSVPAGSLVNMSNRGFFITEGGITKEELVPALEGGAHLLKAAGNEGVAGPGFSERDNKDLIDAVSNSVEAKKRMFWVSGLVTARDGTKNLNGCKGVEDYCISVSEGVDLKVEPSSSLDTFFGTSASSAFAFGLFSLAWERLPAGSHISLVYTLARECAFSATTGLKETPTEEFGLGELSFSCLLTMASDHGRDVPVAAEPFVYALYGEQFGQVSLPGLSDASFQIEHGDLEGDYSLTRGLAASYVPNALQTEHSLPLGERVSLSFRENEEFGATFHLPLAARISFSSLETPTFFGGSGTKALGFAKTTNRRTYLEVDVAPQLSLGIWQTDADAKGTGQLLERVQGKELGITVRSGFQAADNTRLQFYGNASRFEGGTLRLLTAEHDIRRGPLHKEVGFSLSHRF